MRKLLLALICVSCTKLPVQEPRKPHAPPSFAAQEVILANQFLTKIFDGEIAPIDCVASGDEASLLLRTLRPRMEGVEDDLQASLDDQSAVKKLVGNCQLDCTCHYVAEIIRENNVNLEKQQASALKNKTTPKELNRCLEPLKANFCSGKLYQVLDQEKSDFTYDDSSP
jgi:hypothetical protein